MTMPASTRPRVVVLLATVVLALLLLLTRAIDAGASDLADDSTSASTTPPSGVEYIVHSGDTLWAIASIHVAPGDDIRVLVEDIRTANRLDNSVIHPGQVLVIPTAGG